MRDQFPLSVQLREEWIRDAIRMRKLAVRAVIAWAIVATVAVVALTFHGHALTAAAERSASAARHADSALRNSVHTQQLTAAIQVERRAAVFSNCRDQNSRNRSTIREMNTLARRYERRVSPAQRRQIKTSLRNSVLIVDTLTPTRDCRALVRSEIP